MIDFMLTAVIFIVVIIGLGWPYTKPALQYIWTWFRSKFAFGTQVLTWSAPNPNAQGAMLTFYGVEIGRFFIGAVTSQEAFIHAPDEKPEPSRIVVPA